VRLLRLPVDDYLRVLRRFQPGLRVAHVALIAVACALSWWVYVPIHELFHALGCVLGGGEVTRLEIDPIYGATLLQRFFPFVHVGSEYAGRLSGFDTHGSDLTYLLTDFLPFALTVVVGVPLLRRAAAPGLRPVTRSFLLGAAIPIAYAPFVSLFGDYYEMGSIVVSRLARAVLPQWPLERWRSDDLVKLVGDLWPSLGWLDAAGIGASLFLGATLAWLTYAAGAAFARLLVASFTAGGTSA
jgi:hypothetical protein